MKGSQRRPLAGAEAHQLELPPVGPRAALLVITKILLLLNTYSKGNSKDSNNSKESNNSNTTCLTLPV